MDLLTIQTQSREWRHRNFPNHTLLGQVAGATGEVADAGQHALKLEDGRNDGVDHVDGIIDDFGDALIYMMGACDKLGITLEDCATRAWLEVREREFGQWGEAKEKYKEEHQGELAEGFYGKVEGK